MIASKESEFASHSSGDTMDVAHAALSLFQKMSPAQQVTYLSDLQRRANKTAPEAVLPAKAAKTN